MGETKFTDYAALPKTHNAARLLLQ